MRSSVNKLRVMITTLDNPGFFFNFSLSNRVFFKALNCKEWRKHKSVKNTEDNRSKKPGSSNNQIKDAALRRNTTRKWINTNRNTDRIFLSVNYSEFYS
jgi:hypothetical protein